MLCSEAPGGADVAGLAVCGLHARVAGDDGNDGIVTIIEYDEDADLNAAEPVVEVVPGYGDGVEGGG
jgi:hypothetical protein